MRAKAGALALALTATAAADLVPALAARSGGSSRNGTQPSVALQEPAEPELDRLLRLAREASPVVRPQAARRFVALGAGAAARVREVTGGTPAGYAALGQDLIEVLGELDDAAVRADLWKALDDRDFPWRPSAARTLAATAHAGPAGEAGSSGEAQRLRAALADPIAAVRAAGVVGLATLDDRGALDAVRARLADPDDRVRREAAVLVDRWGDASALWWLVEDLRRTDRFFELDTGKLARFEAARLLAARLDLELGFAPERPPTDADNAAALERIAARVTELAGPPPELPRVARAGGADVRAVLGLEVRSCRRGEHFLRWDARGTLWVGTGNAAPRALDAGAIDAVLHAAGEAARALGEVGLWGEPGCDLEVYHVPRGADAEHGGPGAPRASTRAPSVSTRALRVSKGPAAVEGLRPAPLGDLARALLASLPAEAADLRRQVADALTAVGGSLAESSHGSPK